MGSIRLVRWVVAASALHVAASLTHAIEDFEHGIHERFGLDLLAAAFLLALVYAAQLLAAVGLLLGSRLALGTNAILAAVWLAGALVDHLPAVLGAEPWRTGFASEALAVGVMASSALWLVVSVAALALSRRARARRRP